MYDQNQEAKIAEAAIQKQQQDTAMIKGQLTESKLNADKAAKSAKEQIDALRAEEKVTQEMHTNSRIEISNLQNKVQESNRQLDVMNQNVVKLTKRVEELKADYGRLGESYGALLVENKELKDKLSLEPDPVPPPTETIEPGDIATILTFPRALAFVFPGQKEDQVLCVVYTVRDKRFTYYLTSGAGSMWERAASADGNDTFALVRIDKANHDSDTTGLSVESYDPARQNLKEASLSFDGVLESQKTIPYAEGVPPVVTVSRFAPKP
ncbi:MAG: hypothetical protein ACO1RA_06290 [Planctomycetaceae bacterium]